MDLSSHVTIYVANSELYTCARKHMFVYIYIYMCVHIVYAYEYMHMFTYSSTTKVRSVHHGGDGLDALPRCLRWCCTVRIELLCAEIG